MHNEYTIALQRRLMLRAVTRATMCVYDTRFPLEGYDEWAYLIDALSELHEALNDLKPASPAQEE